MPFHPHYLVEAYAGYGHEPVTKYPYWLLTLSSRGRDYQKIIFIRWGTEPHIRYDVALFSHNTVPYIPLESHMLIGTHDPRSVNLFLADIKRLPGPVFQDWVDGLVASMQKRRPAPRAQLESGPSAPEGPADPTRGLKSALRGIRTVLTESYESIRHTAQRVRFAYPPEASAQYPSPQQDRTEASSFGTAGGRNPAPRQIQPGPSPSATAGGQDAAPQQDTLHEMRLIWPEPAQGADNVQQLEQAHESCCVIVGPSLALSILATVVQQHQIIGGVVFVWWCALFWLL